MNIQPRDSRTWDQNFPSSGANYQYSTSTNYQSHHSHYMNNSSLTSAHGNISSKIQLPSLHPKEENNTKNILDHRLRKKAHLQVISDCKNSLVAYVSAIENALGAAQMGVRSNGIVKHEPELSESQMMLKDNLFMAFEILSQKLRLLHDEIVSLRSNKVKPEEREEAEKNEETEEPHSSPDDSFQIEISNHSDEEETQLDIVLDNCQTAFEERKKMLEILEMRMQCLSLRRPNLTREELGAINIPQNIIELAFDANSVISNIEYSKSIVAPKENVTMIFIDIKGSTALWEGCGNVMFESILLYHSLTRKLLQKYTLYECKSNGDGFFLVSASIRNAVLFCLELQYELLQVNWSESLLKEDGAKPIYSNNGNLLFNGLVIRCGIHFSPTPMCIIDPVSGRADYVGTDVNKAARLETVALDGEVAISEDVYNFLEDDIKNKNFPCEVCCRDRGFRKLKGIEQEERVRSLTLKALEERFDFNDSKEALGIEPEQSLTVEFLQSQQEKLHLEINMLQKEAVHQLQTVSQKQLKTMERSFIKKLNQLTKNPDNVDVSQIIKTLQSYQADVKSQESSLESYCQQVKEMGSSSLDKNTDPIRRGKKIKKKIKIKKQPSFSQLSADIHKATVSSVVKVKPDKTASEIEELKAQLQHAKNEVAILRRARRNQGQSQIQTPQKSVLSPSSFSHSSQSQSITQTINSPTSSSAIPIPGSSYGNSISSSPLASPSTPMTNVIFGLSSPRIPTRFESRLRNRSIANTNTMYKDSEVLDLPAALQPDVMTAFNVRQRARSQSMVIPKYIKDSRSPTTQTGL